MTIVEWIDLDREDKRAAVFVRLAEIRREIELKKAHWMCNTGKRPTCVYLREADYIWIMQNAETILGRPVSISITEPSTFIGLKMFVSDQPGPYVDASES